MKYFLYLPVMTDGVTDKVPDPGSLKSGFFWMVDFSKCNYINPFFSFSSQL
jgi:hypothetical protein